MSAVRGHARGAALAATVVGIAAGVVLVGRVVWAERQALRPPKLTGGPGDRAAIVVFGGQTEPTGPSEELVSRLSHAQALYEQGLAATIVVSGGSVVDDEGRTLDEAADMTTWLVEHGVPAHAVMLGLPGDNTRQTVATMARITREIGLRPWLAVSSPYHARRIRDEAGRAGVDVVVSCPHDSPETLVPRVHRVRLLSEVVATVYYMLPTLVTSRISTSAGTWRHSIPHRLARMSDQDR